ncbi:MAG: TIGR03617 family F420-dependent LLM class oxidoreductase [Candidatus Lambdaproteobacteria bacterium]|nr:TIGR03617 family F420-dependent LLM class oxidoreductase [Candidatus Lambdaproteobacteria bacterium]
MKIDTQLRDLAPDQIAGQAARFEKLGFDGIWTFEAAHDAFLPLAVCATTTKHVALGTNISVAFGRSPFAMAQTAWDLQAACGGRFILGLGTQVRAHVERRYSMVFDHPAARITDYVRCVRAIWDTYQNDTTPKYEGPFYKFTLINPFFSAGPIEHPDIPIFLAGINERMCRAAGEVADGFHVHPMNSRGYLRDVVRPAIDAGAKTRGKTVKDVALHAPIFTATGETQAEVDEMVEEVRRQFSFYASTPNYRALLEYHGYPELGKELSKHARVGDWGAMAALVPDKLLFEVAVVAKFKELPKAIHERYDGVLDRVSMYFPIKAADPDAPWKGFTKSFRAA